MVSDVREGTATYTGSGAGNAKGIIDSPYDNRPADAPDNWNPWPVLNSTEAPLDTDRDGMPDAWELARGLDPADPADALLTDDEGYTMVEVYINSLVDHITEAQNEGGTADGDLEYLPDILPSYTVATSTRIPSTWNFGNDITLSNDAGKSYGTRGDYIRLARDVRHTHPPVASRGRPHTLRGIHLLQFRQLFRCFAYRNQRHGISGIDIRHREKFRHIHRPVILRDKAG